MAWISRVGVQSYLTEDEMKTNAIEFYNYFSSIGATLESICGMLGNIQRESGLNPGNKQTSSTSSGWGLIQWTPSTVLTSWCNQRRYLWYNGNIQCYRIKCEGEGTDGASGYFIPTTAYPYTWEEFIALTDVHTAVYAYLYERERAGVEAIEQRLQYADEWYEYLSGQPVPPTPPTPPKPPKRNRMPLYMMCRRI